MVPADSNGKSLEKQYGELAKAFSLPSFRELDKDFDLSDIDSDTLTVKLIRKRVSEKLEEVAKLLEEVLQPDTHIASLYESRAFTEEEKKGIFTSYRRVMKLYRKASELSISSEESENAAFVREVFEFWFSSQGELKRILRRLQEIWEQEGEQESDLAYLG